MAAESHQTGDDGRLAKTDVSHYDHASVGSVVGAAQLSIDFLEEPLAARKHRVHRDAGNLKEQRFQRDVLEPVRREAYCEGNRKRRYKSEVDSI